MSIKFILEIIMSDTVLDVRNLTVEFATDLSLVTAVDRIDFQLKRGKTLGIVGESGSGKSVSSLAIMGLISNPGKVTEGEICFQKTTEAEPIDLLSLKPQQMRHYRGNKIAMIFQEPMSALNPVYTIGFQLTEAILLHQNVTQEQAREQAISLLQEVKLFPTNEQLEQQYLEETEKKGRNRANLKILDYIKQRKQAMLDRYPHQLSGGQLQRVTIAMAISCDPVILIADEPTTALDVTVQATILDLLQELCTKRGMSTIFISHDLSVIANIADDIVVMRKGKIVEKGEKNQILFHPQHPYTQGLLACRPPLDERLKYLLTVSDFIEEEQEDRDSKPDREETRESQIVTPEEEKQRLSQLQEQKPLLSVEKLSVGFPRRGMFGRTKEYFMAVHDLSFEVYPGETLGLVGESGCGKSTLARTILLLIPAYAGKIRFEGKDIINIDQESLRKLRQDMQIVFQNPYNSLNPRMTIGKAIVEPMVIHQTETKPNQRNERVKYLLNRVGLNAEWTNRYPHELSGGQRQRVCIARALALNPKFIICDESVSALDVSVQAQVLNLLKELQEEFNLTYIFISHDLSVVNFMSDRIMVMNQGKIEEIDAARRILEDPNTDYTRTLIDSIPKFPHEQDDLFKKTDKKDKIV